MMTLILFLLAGCSGSSECVEYWCVENDDTGDTDLVDTDDTDPVDTDTDDTDEVELPPEPLRILFVGNEYTSQGPLPDLVYDLARDAGWPLPEVDMSAGNLWSLEGHSTYEPTLALVDEGWDVVVLQDLVTKSTSSAGQPLQFSADMAFFANRTWDANPEARVVLFEPWAYGAGHADYPGTFASPTVMQEQIRTTHTSAYTTYIPQNSDPTGSLGLAAVGDVWEDHLGGTTPEPLHAANLRHANLAGQYLSALVLYGTLYERSTDGLTSWQVQPDLAAELQATADAASGFLVTGGPDGLFDRPLGLAVGEILRLDLGAADGIGAGWNTLTGELGAAGHLDTSDDATSTVTVAVSTAFRATDQQGLVGNTLGYPAQASRDSLECGSELGHAEGRANPGAVTISGLDPAGTYTFRAFASRAGDDSGKGRLTGYRIGTTNIEVEVADNTSNLAVFEDVQPDEEGAVVLDVLVSANGTATRCYLGVLEIERQAD